MSTADNTVLVVDDSPTQLTWMSENLQEAGFTVFPFSSAGSALDHLRHNGSPELIITDLCMPVIDGWRFCRTLRSSEFPQLGATPIIGVSTPYAGADIQQLTVGLGFTAFLSLPCPKDHFVNTVRNVAQGQVAVRPPLMIVNANADIREIFRSNLWTHGYRILEADHGRQALQLFKEEKPELVILDHYLPDLSGLEVLAAIKKEGNPVVVAIISEQNHELIEAYYYRGADACVTMPFSKTYLQDLMNKLYRDRTLLRAEQLLSERTRALQEAERTYSQLIELEHDGVWTLDAKARTSFVNSRLAELLGTTPEAMTGLPLLQFFPEQEARLCSRLMEHHEPVFTEQLETRLRKMDGAVFPVFLRMTALMDTEKRYRGMLVLVEDLTENKRMKRHLKMSEEQYRALAETAPDMIYITGADGIIRYVNSTAARLFNTTPEKIIGKRQTELFPPAVAQRHQDVVNKVLKTGESSFSENPIALPDREVWLDTRLVPLKDEEGRITSVLGISRDITERKLAEKGLLTSNELLEERVRDRTAELQRLVERLRHEIGERKSVEEALKKMEREKTLVLDNLTELVAYQDSHMRFVWVNDAIARAFNKTPAEFIGRYCHEALHGRDTPCSDCPVVKVHRTGEPNEGETLAADGRHWLIRASPVKDDAGRMLGVVELALDITARKTAEAEFRREHNLLQTLFDTVPARVYVKDTESRFLMVNKNLLRHLDLSSPDEMIGKTDFDFFPKEMAEKFYADERDILRTGRPILNKEEQTSPHANGKTAWTLVSKVPLQDEHGQIIGIIGAGRDITERKQMEAQIRQSQKMESISILTGGIAHNFNNLLQTILGNTELVRMHLSARSPEQRFVDSIIKACRRASELTGQMLAFADRGDVVAQSMNLNALLNGMIHQQEFPQADHIHFHFNFADDLPPIKADIAQLRQFIGALITNALEAIGDAEGDITLSTQVFEADRGFLSRCAFQENLPEGAYVRLDISDTGCGMDEKIMPKIFDPFFTTKFTGRGMGLAIALGIMRKHHGAMRVQSVPGRGATFTALFPIDREHRPEAVGKAPAPVEPARFHETILVVDDDESFLKLIKVMLENSGFSILTARDGVDALDIFRAKSSEIAVVLTDLAMPRMDGEQTCREIRRLRPELPVILMSGFSDCGTTQHILDKGFSDFIQKPFQFSELLAKMRVVLKR